MYLMRYVDRCFQEAWCCLPSRPPTADGRHECLLMRDKLNHLFDKYYIHYMFQTIYRVGIAEPHVLANV